MLKVKTSGLSGVHLDWAVAKAWQPVYSDSAILVAVLQGGFHPSTDWAQGGPIIDREDIATSPLPDGLWRAYAPRGTKFVPRGKESQEVFNWVYKQEGYTPLIAAMRCYVQSKMGDEIEIPENLV